MILSLELSAKLKALNFNEESIAWYAENGKIYISPDSYKDWTSKPLNNENIVKVFNKDCITAPTYEDVCDWFEKNHMMLISKIPYTSGLHKFNIWQWDGKHWVNTYTNVNSKEEILNAAINLINNKTVKNEIHSDRSAHSQN